MGVTQLRDVYYIVCCAGSAILRFSATTRQRLPDIKVNRMYDAFGIAACEQTSRVYVSANVDSLKWILRVSTDGTDIQHWLPKSPSKTFKAVSLSVTSARLLVTSSTLELIQFDSYGEELRRIQLPCDMEPWHAVESPTGTFIVRLLRCIGFDLRTKRIVFAEDEHRKRHLVVEVNSAGEVLRQFNPSHRPRYGYHLSFEVAVDSRGNIFVGDAENNRILLLDAQLSLRRVIADEHHLNYRGPANLCYREQSGQLLMTSLHDVLVLDVLRR